ncbi:unnamed protein product [Parnassius apollo]|nr:unnamed protein product [Parnassius apollo]
MRDAARRTGAPRRGACPPPRWRSTRFLRKKITSIFAWCVGLQRAARCPGVSCSVSRCGCGPEVPVQAVRGAAWRTRRLDPGGSRSQQAADAGRSAIFADHTC